MKLDYLKVDNWRNLRHFQIDFDEKESVVAILGQNGTGKSNLIEALVRIFRELDKGASTDFAFELAYLVKGKTSDRRVVVVGEGNPTKAPTVTVDGKTLTSKEWKRLKDDCLPASVFAYYSGSNHRLESEFVDPLREHYRKWFEKASNSETVPVRRFFYSRREYASLVMLAFFLSDDQEAREVLREYLHIDGFDSALLSLRKPWWAGSKPSKVALQEGDPRFWYARGAFTPFLERLWAQALAPFKAEGRKQIDFRGRSEEVEHAYLYIKDETRLKELKWPGESALKIFAFLEALELCGLLDLEATKVKVKHRSGKALSFDHLSEGEQQLVMVLGLMLFNRRAESLFLLDEPDTHLNPQWTYKYFELVKRCFPVDTSHLLIATHNPLMIGSLRANQVRILAPVKKSIADGEVATVTQGIQPDIDPFGMGIDGLLQSEFFGLESVLARPIVDAIHERQELLAKTERTPVEDDRIREISDKLSKLGVAHSFPHPYYAAFANALARNVEYRRASRNVDPMRLKEIEDQAFTTVKLGSELTNSGFPSLSGHQSSALPRLSLEPLLDSRVLKLSAPKKLDEK
jgi:predicted ATPase